MEKPKQAWNKKLDADLRALGYVNSPIMPCIYSKIRGEEWVYLLVYVDDIIGAGNASYFDSDLDKIAALYPSNNLGFPQWILGMRIQRGDGWVTLDQSQYAHKLLEKWGMLDCKPLGSPVDPNFRPSRRQDEPEDDLPPSAPPKAVVNNYAEDVGAFGYLANCTRPDLAAFVNFRSRSLTNYDDADLQALKRGKRYLKLTSNFGLKWTFNPQASDIVGYSDSDWASDYTDRKSTSGYVFKRHGAAISWQTKKQPTPALSSTEAELYALTSTFKEALAWRNRLTSMSVPLQKPTKVFCDSQGALALIRAPASRDSTKHISIRSFFARDAIDRQEIVTEYVASADNAADALTKGLSPEKMRTALNLFGLVRIDG